MDTNSNTPERSHGLSRKGSVKRARQLLDAGIRSEKAWPTHEIIHPLRPRNASHPTQWPLPEPGIPRYSINSNPGFVPPRGPSPRRPPRPDEISLASSSVYSERHIAPHPSSFSSLQPPLPLQPRRPVQTAAPDSPPIILDMAPPISITAHERFRHAIASKKLPPLGGSHPASISLPELSSGYTQRKPTAGPVGPPDTQRAHHSPRFTNTSFVSGRAIASSWGSGTVDSHILGTFLDVDSEDECSQPSLQDDDVTLVRSASLGRRAGKPTMRTIHKSKPVPELPAMNTRPSTNQDTVTNTQPSTMQYSAKNIADTSIEPEVVARQTLYPSAPFRRASISTASSHSLKGIDPENPPFLQIERCHGAGLEKDMDDLGPLPKATSTMSDKRPWGRKPTALNINAVREAEARGSLSSLTELIRRATKLASNLDHGKTASRADFFGNGEVDFRVSKGGRARNSGSIKDMLASFPPPGWVTPDSRRSWPVFFGRSNLRHTETLHSNDQPDRPRRAKKCCGLSRKVFVIICIVFFLIAILAVLLPVFLVAVPRENKESTCEKSNPCHNGGFSVSSGGQCSCLCSNNYTGLQCTMPDDGSCTTALISNGSVAKNASMGSSLPTLFEVSQTTYNLTLDPFTIMALFNLNNASCQTENTLVSFRDVKTDSSSQARRSVALATDLRPFAVHEVEVPASLVTTNPTPVLVLRSEATMNGIVFDDSGANKVITIPTPTESHPSTTTTTTEVQPTATDEAKTVISVPETVVDFSRVVVLYILQHTGSLNQATSLADDIQDYLVNSYTNSTRPTQQVGAFMVDFEDKTIMIMRANSRVKVK